MVLPGEEGRGKMRRSILVFSLIVVICMFVLLVPLSFILEDSLSAAVVCAVELGMFAVIILVGCGVCWALSRPERPEQSASNGSVEDEVDRNEVQGDSVRPESAGLVFYGPEIGVQRFAKLSSLAFQIRLDVISPEKVVKSEGKGDGNIGNEVDDEEKNVSEISHNLSDTSTVCAICLDTVQKEERIRSLPCSHSYHSRLVYSSLPSFFFLLSDSHPLFRIPTAFVFICLFA